MGELFRPFTLLRGSEGGGRGIKRQSCVNCEVGAINLCTEKGNYGITELNTTTKRVSNWMHG